MSSESPESGTEIAQRVEREYAARELLGQPQRGWADAGLAAIGIALGSMAISDFTAPLLVKILFLFSVMTSISLSYEVWGLRRRMNAALVLLGLGKAKPVL